MKLPQHVPGQSGVNSLNQTLAASAAASISPAESDCSGCSYSVRHKLHVCISVNFHCNSFVKYLLIQFYQELYHYKGYEILLLFQEHLMQRHRRECTNSNR